MFHSVLSFIRVTKVKVREEVSKLQVTDPFLIPINVKM